MSLQLQRFSGDGESKAGEAELKLRLVSFSDRWLCRRWDSASVEQEQILDERSRSPRMHIAVYAQNKGRAETRTADRLLGRREDDGGAAEVLGREG